MQIELGEYVKDVVTGFSGTVTGRAEYVSGCTQCLVAPKIATDGAFRNSEWFDEQRLQVQGEQRLVLDNAVTPGRDREAPKR